VTIGRDPGCNIVVDDPYVSPRHCRLVGDESGEWVVQDLDSANGTYVMPGGRRGFRLPMGGARVLDSGDVLMIGRTRMPPFTPERVTG
jgi:pSer/pThr/pTyr-binding forkhead associated (FHA) protein